MTIVWLSLLIIVPGFIYLALMDIRANREKKEHKEKIERLKQEAAGSPEMLHHIEIYDIKVNLTDKICDKMEVILSDETKNDLYAGAFNKDYKLLRNFIGSEQLNRCIYEYGYQPGMFDDKISYIVEKLAQDPDLTFLLKHGVNEEAELRYQLKLKTEELDKKNSKGEIRGIATLVPKEGQNINFAIPSDKIIVLKETPKAPISESLTELIADANDAQSFYDKGLKELWQENYSAALTYFQKAIEKNPDNADAWFMVGDCYGKLGRYQDEIEAYKQAIRIKPDYAEAHYNLGNDYGKLGCWQEAIEAYKEAIRIKPDFAEAHYNLGVAYGNLGRYQEEIEAYKQAIRIKPDLVEPYCNLGTAYGNLGHYQEAIEAFKQAIRIKPDYVEAHYNLGFTYFKLGRYQEAIEAFKQAIRIKPDYAEAYNTLGAAYGKLGHYQEEIEAYKQAIKIKPDLAEAHNNLGTAYLKLGRYQEAIEAYKQAVRTKPDYDNLGNAYFKLGHYQDAIEAYKQAIRIKPDDAEAHYLLGITYLIIGDKDSALEEYKILKTLDVELAKELFNLINK
jgi:tetratricopeptide (TPR) repeat protein